MEGAKNLCHLHVRYPTAWFLSATTSPFPTLSPSLSILFDKRKTNHSTVYNDYNVDKWRECAHTPTITLSAVYSWWTLLVWEFNLFRQSEQVKLIFLVCQVLVLFFFCMHFFKFRVETHSFWANKWRESGRHVTNMTAVTLIV